MNINLLCKIWLLIGMSFILSVGDDQVEVGNHKVASFNMPNGETVWEGLLEHRTKDACETNLIKNCQGKACALTKSILIEEDKTIHCVLQIPESDSERTLQRMGPDAQFKELFYNRKIFWVIIVDRANNQAFVYELRNNCKRHSAPGLHELFYKSTPELLNIFAHGKINKVDVQDMLDQCIGLKQDGTLDGSPKVSVLDIRELSLFDCFEFLKETFQTL